MEPKNQIPLGMTVQESLSEGELDVSDLDTSVPYWEDPEYIRAVKESTEKHEREIAELYAQGKITHDYDDSIEF